MTQLTESKTNTSAPQNGGSTYAADFAALGQRTPDSPAWLTALRGSAFSRFAELGFPTRRDEEWRYTNPAAIANTVFRPAPHEAVGVEASAIAGFTFGDHVEHRLVFVNGRYAAHLSNAGSLPDGVVVRSLAEAMQTDASLVESHLARSAEFRSQAFTALNTAFLEDGAFVHIPRGVVPASPIHLLFVSTGGAVPTVSHPRTLIIAEENSQATIIESYGGSGAGVTFTNAVTEVVLAENAVIDHYKLQRESLTATHIATMQVQLARSSSFSSHSIGLGGYFVRNDANATLGGEGGECTLNGVYLVDGRRLIDNHTFIDHAMPHCNSHEVYKGIVNDQGRGVFNGKILVRLDAQKTDAKQTNKTLLLSPEAQINTKPQLEIFADDVKCTHGATIGQLDPEAMFYLRTRGISEADARALLVYAFASDIISRIKVEPVRAQLDAVLLATLPTR